MAHENRVRIAVSQLKIRLVKFLAIHFLTLPKDQRHRYHFERYISDQADGPQADMSEWTNLPYNDKSTPELARSRQTD